MPGQGLTSGTRQLAMECKAMTRHIVTRVCCILSLTALVTAYGHGQTAHAQDTAMRLEQGSWHAWFDSPGGAMPFGLKFKLQRGSWQAWIINGPERIPVPVVTVADGKVTIGIDYYDSSITATMSEGGKRLDGKWRKKAKGEDWNELDFHATAGKQPRFPIDLDAVSADPAVSIDGAWRVKFEKSEQPALGMFQAKPDHIATGTFLTTTGDYRFLAGTFDGRHLNLSCFDGAHAFLFKAEVTPEGKLSGDFWSRDTWHETWTAGRSSSFSLPDPFALTKPTGKVSFADIEFPDADGVKHVLDGEAFKGKARIIEIFGTWCPNCHDATNYLVQLDKRYRDRGLSIVALAFELTGDFKRDARLVKTYAERHEVTYPILIAGMADKDQVAKAFPFIDKLRSYPTTIFLDATGEIKAIHTGFSGPATGVVYLNQRAKFESIIESLLKE